MAKIVHRYSQAILFEDESETIKEAAVKAVSRGADLRGAYLRGADLRGAYLTGAYLTGADLRGAYLTGAYLRGAYLTGAYLTGADLRGAYLRGADLGGADLRGAYLTGAYLTGADLTGAKINWTSHALISDILRRAAGDDIDRLKFAGLVLLQISWCWKEFTAMQSDPQLEMALRELAKWIQPEDNHPAILDRYNLAETVKGE
jgi:uncharacterized protein YjbI with pentapeptide repeats